MRNPWLSNLPELLHGKSQPPFRYNQILQWIFDKKVYYFNEMLNLPADLRKSLSARINILPLYPGSFFQSDDKQTYKWKLITEDERPVECVVIQSGKRNTLCISSHSGCPFNCRFCATGQMPHHRKLNVDEIIGQFLIAQKEVGNITNIVFMGMGEPLLNFDNVKAAISFLSDKDTANIGMRRFTISTAGTVPGIIEMSRQLPQCILAVSLNSTFPEIRAQIMPAAEKTHPLPKLLEALRSYQKNTNNRFTFEYVLLDKINTRLKDAIAIQQLYPRLKFNLNIIPHNEFPGSPYKRPDNKTIAKFKGYFNGSPIEVIQRYKKGSDISAACGQLGS